MYLDIIYTDIKTNHNDQLFYSISSKLDIYVKEFIIGETIFLAESDITPDICVCGQILHKA